MRIFCPIVFPKSLLIEELHQEASDKGKLAGFFMSTRTGHQRDEGEKAHLAAA